MTTHRDIGPLPRPHPARRPTREELLAAAGRTLDDVVGENLRLLLVGINPGLYTAAIGHHFGRPGNRFWPLLHAAGITERRLDPGEQRLLLARGVGITNIVPTATAQAAQVTREQLRAGAATLEAKVRVLRPGVVAILGMQAFRVAFDRPRAVIGPQPEALASSRLWLLPNPSGLQARYPTADMVAMMRAAGEAAGVVDTF